MYNLYIYIHTSIAILYKNRVMIAYLFLPRQKNDDKTVFDFEKEEKHTYFSFLKVARNDG